MFNPGRSWEQVRTIMALNETNVKIAGAHAGVSVGPDGATHQAIEDIAIMRVIPHMMVVVPCDSVQTKKATLALSERFGPAYLRFAREKSPIVTSEETPFEIGKAQTFREGSGRCDRCVRHPGLQRARRGRRGLRAKTASNAGSSTITRSNRWTSRQSSLPPAIAVQSSPSKSIRCTAAWVRASLRFSLKTHPVPIEFIGVHDQFGQSGDPVELIEHYGMGTEAIKEAIRRAYRRKK